MRVAGAGGVCTARKSSCRRKTFMLRLESKLFPSLVLFGLSMAAGCGANTQDDYMPEAESAKAALKAALDAWKAGQPLDKITSSTPVVQPVDYQWKRGDKLESYEILEQVADAKPIQFKVKLTVQPQDASATPEAVYTIV